MVKASTFAKRASAAFPGISGIRVAPELGGASTVLLGDAAEGGVIEGFPAAEYYPELEIFGQHSPWINPKLERFVERQGYVLEWYDPGTLLAYTWSY